ncbi:MAG: lyase family protein [Bacteroidetes bacterium]|nr:lyase family protein [Bacteroidota bacterium]
MRKEQDFLGEMEMPSEVLYGIHSCRARENFPDRTAFHREWYEAIGIVKKACYLTCREYFRAAALKYPEKSIRTIDDVLLNALILSASEVAEGLYFHHWIVPAVSGGAGTSINMNANEIIANASLLKLGRKPGDYAVIDPLEHANVYQSTNDVIPTSLKVCIIKLLVALEASINETRDATERLESGSRNSLKIAFTQMQEAVPSSFGKLFSTYSEALSRDWWRVSKCSERLKLVNLGGGAVGTGLSVPRFFIMEVVSTLQKLTGLPVARSENMADATSNLDSFVEVHAILKAHAVNLEKIASDIRLMASDINKPMPLLSIPARQTGSTIMPGKVNPVIPEFVISAAHQVYANDQLVSGLCSQGCLELNAYIPLIGHSIISSLKLLISANRSMRQNLLQGLVINSEISHEQLMHSPSITTALLPFIGYNKASDLARLMKAEHLSVFEANDRLKLVDPGQLAETLKAENLLKMGYTIESL